ncbi:sporulation integral membrane protein YtvI [Planifilum fimeticola]|uniref:Sporulation integral membrane protein YtvI n=1 Tax=Planifilum fimeticola TaxID=201975 RepID=A0A2T0LFQ5_9BACL|nr:sporulation integral membrane protein YtvI [Planifilum fimeticola]PRX41041.1 sporulation integral membrane protein YtvI [Planifilum fimeticola]
MNISSSQWIGILIRLGLLVLIGVATYYALSFALPLLYPFLIGWLIAMAIEPAVRFLERRLRLPRWAGVSLMLIIVLAVVSSLLVLLITQVVVELTRLAEFLPSNLDRFNQYLLDVFLDEDTGISQLIHNVQTYLQNNPEHQKEIVSSIRENLGIITQKGTEMITDIIAGIGSFLTDLPYIVAVIVIIFLAALFIGLDWPRMRATINRVLPERVRRTGGIVLKDIRVSLFGFVRAQLTLITITAILVLVGLWILGVKYALTVAIIVGVVDLLPYLGVGAVLVPWSAYSYFFGGDTKLAVGLLILYGVLLVVRQSLEAKLVSSNVGLDPLTTLIALFVGLNLFGFIGLIIGPVSVVIMIALYRAHVFRDLWRFIKGDSFNRS